MSQVSFVALLALAVFVLAAFASPLPSQDTIQRCIRIGYGSGCSGCNSNTTSCDWCTIKGDNSRGVCLPEGSCTNEVGRLYQVEPASPGVCPEDINDERDFTWDGIVYRQSPISYYSRPSPAFDSKYCDFPSQPWVVDRTLGYADAERRCFRVNNQLSMGQIGEILACVNGVFGGKTRDVSEPSKRITSLTERSKECLRQVQSLRCTVACPERGEPLSSYRLCHEYCQRVNQVCGNDIVGNCLRGFNPGYGCAAKGDTDCFSPDLIPASGRFENDLCFLSSSSACKAVDCKAQVAPSTVAWPAFMTTYQGFGPRSGFTPGQTGPACCLQGFYDARGGAYVAFLVQITDRGTPAGLPCAFAAEDAVRESLGDAVESVDAYCFNEQWCIAIAYYTSSTAPTGCTASDDNGDSANYNCPGAAEWVWD